MRRSTGLREYKSLKTKEGSEDPSVLILRMAVRRFDRRILPAKLPAFQVELAVSA